MVRTEVLELLEREAFSELLGAEEGVEVEFKGAPYRLDEEAAKFALAKDVSGLANARGGVIVIGVRTESTLRAPADVACELRPVPRERLDEKRVDAVVQSRVYPRMRGFDVTFYQTGAHPSAGLLCLHVPPQDEADKYFLVQRPLAGDAKTPGWLVAVMIRGVDSVHEQRAGELHALINRGRNIGRQLSDLASAVSDIQERMIDGTFGAEADESPADRLDDVITARLEELAG